ncbi:cardiolipin synthase [Methanofollis sp. W23]|uniref:cardiolipin synthase n=1 Tax=Methanofollis sp. W23 TaxID=2817849 RepID=UPI001AEABE31|nr:cardiolipin synthase [Methanofollis sp. W23]MBP2147156.1 cardiolipin synthase [Methanofollis sp. W23]
MEGPGTVCPGLLVLNALCALLIIFFEQKNPAAARAWIIVLVFIPALGFVLYLLLGQNLYKERLFILKKKKDDQVLRGILREQEAWMTTGDSPLNDRLGGFRPLASMLFRHTKAALCPGNEVEVYTGGAEKFSTLFEAIQAARDHIHLQYYIIRDDRLGRQTVSALAEKASEGCKVRVLYDAVGCRKLPKKFFKPLTDAGGEVTSFFPLRYLPFNLRVNYRNHRKITVVDGNVGFIGGFNPGTEYLGEDPHLGPWRDTHLKIAGKAVSFLQLRFFQDWNYAAGADLGFEGRYFPACDDPDDVLVQVVSSGPDSLGEEIKKGYLKLISSAHKSVYVQSPYFVPDESVLDALTVAALSGVDVRVMIPCKPDHPFVYWATYSYIGDLVAAGVRAYTYDAGFLHAKTIVVDGVAASVGSANWDIRSFRLNFEANAFIYDRRVAGRLKAAFEADLADCTEVTPARYVARSRRVKAKESVFRLFSGVL